jgi:phosphomannomutase/phosphoglucomutase
LEHKEKNLLPRIKELNFIDGVRIEFDKGWGLLRPSNTQAVLVLRFEGKTEKHLQDYQKLVESYLEKSKGELK